MVILSFLLALLFSALASAQNPIVNTRCYTRYSLRRTSSVRTTNYATTTTRWATALNIITPTTTITPRPITSSVSTTSTSTSSVTAPTTTDTFTLFTTTTQTGTSVTTLFLEQWVTETSTSTIATSTTTVAPPVGFTNLAEAPGYAAKKRNAVLDKIEAMEERAAPAVAYLPFVDEAPAQTPAPTPKIQARQATTRGQEFPVAVSCTRSTTWVRTTTSTYTASTTARTTLIARTVWTTITVPASTVTTITPARVTELATITSHATSTVTSTSETTSTRTSTQRVDVPAATFLAQCAPKNLVSTAVGQKIGTISFNPAFTLQSLYVQEHAVYGRGYSCCAQCVNDKSCAGFAQAPDSGTQKGACYYITTDGRCDKDQSWGDRAHYWNTNGDGYIVGNAQCGFLGWAAGRPRRT